MIGNREDSARFHSDFYRDKYLGMLRSLLISVCMTVILICGIVYLVLFREPPQYYATTVDGQIIPMAQNSNG
jgi:hypothetical protein